MIKDSLKKLTQSREDAKIRKEGHGFALRFLCVSASLRD
jgi:hypothetical protein